MARKQDERPDRGQEMDDPKGEGVRGKVSGAVRRTMDVAQRAARAVRGRFETSDVLFQALHEDHEEVSRLLDELLGTDVEDRARELWREIETKLVVHTRAEQETVYPRLQRDDPEGIAEARQEHASVEDLVQEVDAAGPGTDEFFGLVEQLKEMVQHHVNEEERQILPRAEGYLDDDERQRLVKRFRDRKNKIMEKTEVELGVPVEGVEIEPDTPTEQPRRSNRGRSGSANLEDRSTDELYQLAKDRKIPGRSQMNKQQLLDALKKAS